MSPQIVDPHGWLTNIFKKYQNIEWWVLLELILDMIRKTFYHKWYQSKIKNIKKSYCEYWFQANQCRVTMLKIMLTGKQPPKFFDHMCVVDSGKSWMLSKMAILKSELGLRIPCWIQHHRFALNECPLWIFLFLVVKDPPKRHQSKIVTPQINPE